MKRSFSIITLILLAFTLQQCATKSGDEAKGDKSSARFVKKFKKGEAKKPKTEVVETYWTDAESGLMWQNPADDKTTVWRKGEWQGPNWRQALKYCDQLEWAGYKDWRLPNIDELRSLIRGCTMTMPRGLCGVSKSCLGWECWDRFCQGCEYGMGASGGYYWPEEIENSCRRFGFCSKFWSSSICYKFNATRAWLVDFSFGIVHSLNRTFGANVRCVRNPSKEELVKAKKEAAKKQ